MRRLSSLIVLLTLAVFSLAQQSPHGPELKISCSDCHNPNGWKLTEGTYTFSHNSTEFALVGQHQTVNCKSCHKDLVFSNAQSDCISCHTDVHEQTVGNDCARCHTPQSWLVSNTTQLHQESRFPLLGAHATADCFQCHESASLLQFNPLGIDCFDCHKLDYEQAKEPDHVGGDFSTDCMECHAVNSFSWKGAGLNHLFFPLTEGHAINNCFDCHTQGQPYSSTKPECINCHQSDFQASTNPDHQSLSFSDDCKECHTTNPGWKPAKFTEHDPLFQIYSGSHNNEWDNCTDCHTSQGNYSLFSCTNCHDHNQSLMDEKHAGIGGYIFRDDACFECHPQGNAEGSFDHAQSNFPLTGAHIDAACVDCHNTGYAGTTTVCGDCHLADFNASVNPNHAELGISNSCESCHTTEAGWAPATMENHNDYYLLDGAHISVSEDCISCHDGNYVDSPNTCFGCHNDNYGQTSNPNHQQIGIATECELCHTTQPDWKPAAFPTHNDYYALNGAHNTIASDCFSCHEGSYTNTPNLCFGCHADDYNQTTNPPHAASQFSTECETCHSETAWIPSTFDHDAQYFPIFSGKHAGQWISCSECHTTPNNYTQFSCIECHEHNQTETDNDHNGVSGYTYNSNACYECHPTGEGEGFNHNLSDFPLTGAHLTVECILCHENGFSGTSTVCSECHINDFNQSSNPNHVQAGIPITCETCHTTVAGWAPATYPIHNETYPLTGAHLTIQNDCFTCHEGNYSNTPNSCFGCHETDFNQSLNPNHQLSAIPTSCETCHTTAPGWAPASFPIHNDYYPLNGAHTTVDCFTCHEGSYINTPNLCYGCHASDYNQTTNPNHIEAQFPTTCESCHSETAWTPSTFDHDGQYFPIYSGSHAGEWTNCNECHTSPGNYAEFNCIICHTQNETNNEHQGVVGYQWNSQACFACHPNGEGDGFNHSLTDFPLTGAHITVACIECHENGYTGTSTVCSDCHTADYNQSTNPNHVQNSIPTTCENCHTTEPGWAPATFPIHDDYYALTGAHQTISADCFACHEGNYTNTPNTCAGCHTDNYNATTNPDHAAINIPTDCELCHTTNPNWVPAGFPIHNDYYVLAGAHVSISCADCHQGDYNNTPNSCYGCHQADYEQTTDPDHATAQFPTTCEDCHTQTSWTPSTFDHDGQYFPIYSGSHQNEWTSCSECHTNPNDYTVFNCIICHTQTETNNEHQGISGYTWNSDACYACHPNGEGDGFNHNTTDFPLTGAHLTVACLACHEDGYTGTSTVCSDCHIADFNQSTNPNHQQVGIPTTCETCHTTAPGWAPATFPIHNNYYALTGAHQTISADCFACHEGDYNNTPNTCVGCHTPDYNQATNPNHVTLNIPTDCAMCHTTNPTWEPATFPIHSSYYVLAGAHVSLNCDECHSGNYNNTIPTDCFGCHQTDYNQTSDPDHQAAQFPTTCEDCHTQTSWVPSTFDHDDQYFPIYSGEHNGEWNTCSDCHTNPNDYSVFTCLTCHQQGETNNDHDEVSGYQYNSNACYACHPNGEGDKGFQNILNKQN